MKVPSWQRYPHATAQTLWLISSAQSIYRSLYTKYSMLQRIIQICPTEIWEDLKITYGCIPIMECFSVFIEFQYKEIWWFNKISAALSSCNNTDSPFFSYTFLKANKDTISGEQLQTVSIFFRSRNLKASAWAMYLGFCFIVKTSFWAELEIKLAFLRCMAQNSKAEIPRCPKMMNSISH